MLTCSFVVVWVWWFWLPGGFGGLDCYCWFCVFIWFVGVGLVCYSVRSVCLSDCAVILGIL